MDTTRADYIDTGLGAKAYTPEIKKFAKKSLVFERAYTTIPLTLPAHLSIFSSCLPHELGVLNNDCFYEGSRKLIQEALRERDYYTAAVISLGTLAGSTGFNRGYDDFFEDLFDEKIFFVPAEKVVNRALRVVDARAKNMGRNFFLFLHFSDPHSPYAPPSVHTDLKISVDGVPLSGFNAYHGAILRNRTVLKKGSHTIDFKLAGPMDDFRFFIIRRLEFGKECSLTLRNLTFSEKHYGGSYLLQKPEGSIRVFCHKDSDMKLFQVIPILSPKAAVRYYREEVEYMDRQIGKFLGHLERTGLLKKTIVAMFADHGEGLGERHDYYGHTRYLNQQFIHVPFILHLPHTNSGRFEAPVSMTALSPTVLDFLGIRSKDFSQEKSVLPLIRAGKRKSRHAPVYSFAYAPDSINDKFSVIRWPYQGIFYLEGGSLSNKEIYNLSMSQSYNHKDAIYHEVIKRNSIVYYKNFLQEFARLKKTFLRGAAGKTLVDNLTLDRLNSLGYTR
jgi:membrane-anchored protein YejM (alkaline phosphatase superfamily)